MSSKHKNSNILPDVLVERKAYWNTRHSNEVYLESIAQKKVQVICMNLAGWLSTLKKSIKFHAIALSHFHATVYEYTFDHEKKILEQYTLFENNFYGQNNILDNATTLYRVVKYIEKSKTILNKPLYIMHLCRLRRIKITHQSHSEMKFSMQLAWHVYNPINGAS